MLRDSMMTLLGVKDSDTVVLPGFGGLPNAQPLILNRMSNNFGFPWADGLLVSLVFDY